MILLFHIVVAVASLVWTAVLYFKPSRTGLYAAYGLVGAMLLSGFYLVLSKPGHMVETCVTGLAYLAFVSYAIVAARNKLVSITNK